MPTTIADYEYRASLFKKRGRISYTINLETTSISTIRMDLRAISLEAIASLFRLTNPLDVFILKLKMRKK